MTFEAEEDIHDELGLKSSPSLAMEIMVGLEENPWRMD